MNEYRRIMKIIIKRREILKRTVIIGSSRENGKFAFPSEEIFSKYLFLNKKIYVYGYSKKDRLISKSLKKIGVNYTYLEQTNNKYSRK